jgi:hypothetical protein
VLDFRRPAPGVTGAEVAETPLELARAPARWRRLFGPAMPLERTVVARFEREEISPGVMVFSAGTGASTLVVGFSGRWLRLMLPVAGILQNLDDTRVDLLLLTDETRGHYRNGVGAFASSFYTLCRSIDNIRSSMGYRHMITYGTSMGGLPALRAGVLLKADRSVALGPRYAWDISRIRNAKRRADAFDPLCACRETTGTAWALYSQNVADDVTHAQKLCRAMPDVTLFGVPAPDHNLLFPLMRQGRLGAFHAALLDPALPLDGETLRAAFGPLPAGVKPD